VNDSLFVIQLCCNVLQMWRVADNWWHAFTAHDMRVGGGGLGDLLCAGTALRGDKTRQIGSDRL
jgi:hypothetical protein